MMKILIRLLMILLRDLIPLFLPGYTELDINLTRIRVKTLVKITFQVNTLGVFFPLATTRGHVNCHKVGEFLCSLLIYGSL